MATTCQRRHPLPAAIPSSGTRLQVTASPVVALIGAATATPSPPAPILHITTYFTATAASTASRRHLPPYAAASSPPSQPRSLSELTEVSPLDRWGNTPLDDALNAETDGATKVAEYLTSKGASRGKGGAGGDSTVSALAGLCEAAASVPRLRKLAKLCDVNKGDYDKRTACHLAASEGQLEALKVLIEELGAEHSPLDRWKHTPLDDARREPVLDYLETKSARRGRGFRERKLSKDLAKTRHLRLSAPEPEPPTVAARRAALAEGSNGEFYTPLAGNHGQEGQDQ